MLFCRPGLDDDLLLLAGSLVPRVDVDDAVGVDVEGHLNLKVDVSNGILLS